MTRGLEYGRLGWSGRGWAWSDVPPDTAIQIKRVFPRIKKTAVSPFDFDDAPETAADLQWFLSRYPAQIARGDAIRLGKLSKAHADRKKRIAGVLDRLGTENATSARLTEGSVVRGYQVQACDLLAEGGGLLLADDVGLGKTYTALGHLCREGSLPAAVVMQAHLQTQWREKAEEFTTLRVHTITAAKPYPLPDADVYLFKYSQLNGWIDTFETARFKTVVFDEVQELRRGFDALKGIASAELVKHARYRLGLSATPIFNYGDEIHTIMTFLAPGPLGTREEFLREWCLDFGRVKDPEALGAFLRRSGVFLRRTKADVGQHMPPVTKIVEAIPSDPKAMAAIENLARSLSMRALHGTFTERGSAARELDLLVRMATGVGKAPHVADFVRILAKAGVPVLLAGWHRDVYSVWNQRLRDLNPQMYTGSESPRQKEEAKQEFVSGRSNILMLSLRSGAGIDGLQGRCSTVVFGELDYSPQIHKQVTGRLDREGQHEPITEIFLNSEDGSDPPMLDVLGLKASQSHGIVNMGQSLVGRGGTDSRVRLLAARYLTEAEMRAATQDEVQGELSLV